MWSEAAAREVLAEHRETVHWVVRRMRAAGAGVGLEWEDLEAEAQWAVLVAVQRYEPGTATLTSWVRTKVRYRLIDVIRAASIHTRKQAEAALRYARGEADDDASAMAAARREVSVQFVALADGGPDPEQCAVETERRRWLAQAMCQLKPRVRRALEMRLAGCTQHEIGQALGVTESRACQLLKEGTRRLTTMAA